MAGIGHCNDADGMHTRRTSATSTPEHADSHSQVWPKASFHPPCSSISGELVRTHLSPASNSAVSAVASARISDAVSAPRAGECTYMRMSNTSTS